MLRTLLLTLVILSLSACYPTRPENQNLLPENYAVHVNKTTVINHSVPGFSQKTLPTNNDYRGTPGCYVACYSHSKKEGIYAVSNTIYVNGQVRVAGEYKGRICQPREKNLNYICAAKISSCRDKECWVGGDTGGWFGLAR